MMHAAAEARTPIEPGMIRFHDAAPPPIPPGDYSVQVSQSVAGGHADAYTAQRGAIDRQVFTTTAQFTVAGPRFYLRPDEVYAVYPPAGQVGAFNNALPHIVFTRRTLPWERTLDGAPPLSDAPVPWLALLLLSPEDVAPGAQPKVRAARVRELLGPGGGIQGPAGLALEHWQSLDDVCSVIDLPAALFAKVAPAAEELALLAHVREVNTGGKETLSLSQDGWFTVVLGSRLPATRTAAAGVVNTVCLVSLEGFRAFLPKLDANGTPTISLPAGATAVRLAVLASWSFTCHDSNTFKDRINELNAGAALSLTASGVSGSGDGAAAVRAAFGLGYVGLNHVTRLGETTVSWYRGPLIPGEIALQPPYAPIPCADRALRYDPDTGLFATEYAAAFQLGRLLGLQNRGFAAAMLRYRANVAQSLASAARREALEAGLGLPDRLRSRRDKPGGNGTAPLRSPGSLEAVLASLLAEWDGAPPAPPSSPAQDSDPFTPPVEVARFLARAVLLYGIPFHYLVPDERMLPAESIRFFHIDPGWIATLIQGATSIGRASIEPSVLDTYLATHALEQAMADRAGVAGVRQPGGAASEPRAAKARWPLTGFLLRSELVEGWQGLEMTAFGDEPRSELAPLRIDRLAPDILLCLFNGRVMELVIKQPPEGLHFGLSHKGNGAYERLSLRAVGTGGKVDPGVQIPGSPSSIAAPMRPPAIAGPPTRVVRVKALAETFAKELAKLGYPDARATSAQFAVQMVESPGRARFTGAVVP